MLASMLKSLGEGAVVTVAIFALVIVLSLPTGLGLMYVRTGRAGFLARLVQAFIFVERGTPLMLQLFFFFYGLPFIPFIGKFLVMDRFPAAVLCFTLNYAAYFAEIFRGSLLSVDEGQHEAARVLGLTKLQTARLVVIPQMMRTALPGIANETITLVKDTALATSIGVLDLLHFAKTNVNRTSSIWAFVAAGVFYLVFTFVLTRVFARLEKRYAY